MLAGWQIYTGVVPVAVRCADPAWTGEDIRMLGTLACSLAFGFDQIDRSWTAAHANTRCLGYLIRIGPSAAPGDADVEDPSDACRPDRGVEVEHYDDGRLVHVRLGLNSAELAERAAADVHDVREILADTVEQIQCRAGISTMAATAVRTAWIKAQPTYSARVENGPSAARQYLPEPWPLDDALLSAANRSVAEAVRATGTAPGTYNGDQAKALDRDVLAPAALRILTERLQRHAADDVIAAGMRQIDRGGRHKSSCGGPDRWRPRDEPIGDRAQRTAELENEHVILRRCCETVI